MSGPPETVDFLQRLLGRVERGGIGLEVGSHTGRTTAALVDTLQPRKITLVDPWVTDPAYRDRACAPKSDDAALAAARQAVEHEFGGLREVTIMAKRSEQVVPRVAARSLDWIWLDGCKYYTDLLSDLEAALAAVKPGGLVMGAGCDWGPELGHPVRRVLEVIAARMSPAPEVIRDGDLFAIVRPSRLRLAPRAAPDRVLAIAPMKNEAPYILEWIAHYRAIGFTDFLVYTNDCDDTTDPLLQRLTTRGLARHEQNVVLKRGPHKSALKYAQDHWMVAEANWVLICDVDEFLNLRDHDTVQDYLASLPGDTDIVPFPWQIFGSGGVLAYQDQPVTEQFTACEAHPRAGGRKMRDMKTIFRRPLEIDRFGLHRPRFRGNQGHGFVWRRPDGTDISDEMNTTAASKMRWRSAEHSAYMNHYPIRAVEAYLCKKLRGRANHQHEDLGEEYFHKWNLNDDEDRSILRFGPAMRAELDVLLADAETRRLHDEGVAQTKGQIARLLADPVFRQLYDSLAGAPATPAPDAASAEPTRRERTRRKLLEHLPQGGEVAEIGVWEGAFSAEILHRAAPRKLHLIDPWEYQPAFSNTAFGRKRNAERMPRMYRDVCARFADDPRVVIHRAPSEKALATFADHSLDWVYIDGNHNDPFISDDLALALQKVRPGGWIAGGDYFWNKDDGAPVKTAVDRVVADLGAAAEFKRFGQQYLIRRPG